MARIVVRFALLGPALGVLLTALWSLVARLHATGSSPIDLETVGSWVASVGILFTMGLPFGYLMEMVPAALAGWLFWLVHRVYGFAVFTRPLRMIAGGAIGMLCEIAYGCVLFAISTGHQDFPDFTGHFQPWVVIAGISGALCALSIPQNPRPQPWGAVR